MGISGLLPLLKSATEHVPLSRFKGKLIAVDGNVWIHRGTYSCAMELAEGTPTIAYVRFCQKMAEAITSLGVRLLIVFDGRSLPAKGPAHQRRREKRRQAHQALSAIAELTREQEFSMASEEDPERKRQLGEEAGQLQHERERSARNAAHVTDAMVLQVMDALSRLPGVDVLRAPYEADAQLPNPNPNPNPTPSPNPNPNPNPYPNPNPNLTLTLTSSASSTRPRSTFASSRRRCVCSCRSTARRPTCARSTRTWASTTYSVARRTLSGCRASSCSGDPSPSPSPKP